MTVYFPHESAIVPIVANPGSVINLGQYLSELFSGGGYSFQWFYNDNLYDQERGYWNWNSAQASSFTIDGVTQPVGFFSADSADLADVNLVVGNEINNRLLVRVNTGTGPGADETWTQFWIKVVPDVYVDPTPNIVDGSDVVAAARAFGALYAGTYTPDGCHDLAMSFAAAAGAPLPMESGSIVPSENRDGGLWSVVHRGDQNLVTNWQSLLQPGDIVRYDYLDPSQPFHTFTVLSTQGDRVETLDNLFVNGNQGTLNFHLTNFERFVDPGTVTIYRITDTHHVLKGSAGADFLSGSILNDKLVGLLGNDNLAGGLGDDILIGGAGNDRLNGGHGRDAAVIIDQLFSSSWKLVNGELTIISADGSDTLVDVERIQFNDQTADGSLNDSAAALLQIWQFLSGSTPDEASFNSAFRLIAGMNGMMGTANGWNGYATSLADSNFAPEFVSRYKNLDTNAFINAVTTEVFGHTINTEAVRNSFTIYKDFFAGHFVASDPTGEIRAKGYFIGDMLHQASDINYGQYNHAADVFLAGLANGTANYGQDLFAA